jgi:hypothetical protein
MFEHLTILNVLLSLVVNDADRFIFCSLKNWIPFNYGL